MKFSSFAHCFQKCIWLDLRLTHATCAPCHGHHPPVWWMDRGSTDGGGNSVRHVGEVCLHPFFMPGSILEHFGGDDDFTYLGAALIRYSILYYILLYSVTPVLAFYKYYRNGRSPSSIFSLIKNGIIYYGTFIFRSKEDRRIFTITLMQNILEYQMEVQKKCPTRVRSLLLTMVT